MLTLSVCLAAFLAAFSQTQPRPAARETIERAIRALGGEAALQSIRTLQIDAMVKAANVVFV